MIEDPKAFSAGNPQLQSFDALARKFDNFTAGKTDQVVMMFSLGAMLKAGHAVSKLARRGPPALSH
jgi:hypothetical protein